MRSVPCWPGWTFLGPEPGFEVYDDPASGSVEIAEGIMRRIRQAAAALKLLAVGEDRRAIDELLRLLDRGWVDESTLGKEAGQRPRHPARRGV